MSKRKRQREAAMQAKRIYDQDESVLQALQRVSRDRPVKECSSPIKGCSNNPSYPV